MYWSSQREPGLGTAASWLEVAVGQSLSMTVSPEGVDALDPDDPLSCREARGVSLPAEGAASEARRHVQQAPTEVVRARPRGAGDAAHYPRKLWSSLARTG